ncbi:NUDIX domain-containing protein [Streptococcus agalactiae]|nr:NUDIX hydrolase [Streptococcus agalactiae 138P]AHX74701.1 NUDIX hydrolase [Streptococcus agalactiae]AKU01477.1 NUDIX hydrolase [Streptococcus agalactiae]AWQ29049.1 NUDIX domain-containing protein [Streptococcus agalactiae]OZG39284.1 NUDIX hydrolase [Streptococcus agalactiae]
MEIWDAYDQYGIITGLTLNRDQNIPQGLFHLVVDVILFHEDGDVLMMKRHPKKKAFPAYFEATAGGSALKGENAKQAILRELKEETGIVPQCLTFLNREWFSERSYFVDHFIAKYNGAKDIITLQEGETVDYIWLKPEYIDLFLSKNKLIPSQIKLLKSLI